MNSIPKKTILLIEDDSNFRALLTMMLARQGFNMIEASDGFEAATLFQQHQSTISLVISDLMMPRMTGMELLNSIRKTSDVPMILITGNDSALKNQAFTDIKFVSCLEKPFHQSALVSMIDKALTSVSAQPFKVIKAMPA